MEASIAKLVALAALAVLVAGYYVEGRRDERREPRSQRKRKTRARSSKPK